MSYTEKHDSQNPALLLLHKLGWTPLSQDEALAYRSGFKSQVILETILLEQLKKINSFTYKSNTYPFSEGNIHAAIHALKNVADEGLVRTSERVYDLLTLGKSFEETIQGDRKSFSIRYINWEKPERNVFHVAEEFVVEGIRETRRPDLVLFINGIPMVVIENKRRDKEESIEEAISQFLRNQGKETGIPRLFYYAQLLMAVHPNAVKYATIDTKPKQWAVWEEPYDIEPEVSAILASTLPGTKRGAEKRLPTVQDKMLYSLCRIERLMELVYKFTLYDGPVKKIARYQQYFTVKNTIERVKDRNEEGQRKGGVIWHTQGSGKSLTMVMLAKSLALDKDIRNPRVIIVTDRKDLDRQITGTFEACQKHPVQARNGAHLAELIEDNGVEVITALLNKFDTALNKQGCRNESSEIFVLVDESHRSQYKKLHTKMKRVLPNACYIGFTGTPLTYEEKNTASKFGGFIYPTYTIDRAVRDGAVVPLLYEGRNAKLSVNKPVLDKEFNRLTESLPEYQTKDLERKYASISQVYRSEQVVQEIAYDVSKHFCTHLKNTGFKAMLAVPFQATALKYLKYFEEQLDEKLKINARVIISAPDARDGYDEVDEDPSEEVNKWWSKTEKLYAGGMEEYERISIEKFKNEDDEVEMLIVVGKLLTGFDAPNCTTLYLAKFLVQHNLLQAIARVNRVYEGKDFGHIIDYVGVLGELDLALTKYAALSDYAQEDIEGAVQSPIDEIKKLPQRHGELLDVFKEVKNKKDKEELERFLQPQDRRDLFAEKLTAFAKNLDLALSSIETEHLITTEKMNYFIREFKFYDELRRSLCLRYADKIDYKEYEKKIRKLLDVYVGAEGMDQIAGPINIFNKETFKEEVERITGSKAAKADAIAHSMKKTISENMEKDPVYYKKFSDKIDEVIKDFINKRITEAQYLASQMEIRDQFIKGNMEGTPSSLHSKPEARAFFGILQQELGDKLNITAENTIDEQLAVCGLDLENLISSFLIRDWQRNDDVQKQIQNALEDYLLDKYREWGVTVNYDELDELMGRMIKVAKNVYS
ncbi:MAG: type I restriction endonuclease subunit R [Chitinophagales bacterium]|nr:type I restriction endonuclease subunit R [Chitinophagales bacterium]